MIQKITPFLWFDKNCEEALNFYISIFKNSKIVSIAKYPDGPLEGPMKGFEGKVLTAVFELEGQRFMALDGGPIFKPNAAISFYMETKDQEETDAYWNRLAEGSDPASHQCGWIQDKYGFYWQIIPSALPRLLTDPDKAKSNRVMQAMLKMKKIVVADLEKAASGM
jgi:predicted 3-demethylubiquinone-9 3-methyltransferase (glyoxalase superfamily)